jgi:methylmalonyl-CoA/ethylmalonyl-CoA epimerase
MEVLMSAEQDAAFKLPPVHQLGFVVRDIEKTCKHYETVFGTGPFSPVIDVDMDGALLRGTPVKTKIKVAFVQSGGVQIELIQPVEGHNVYTEFLETKGEGIHHLGYQIDDIVAAKAAFRSKGLEPVFCRDMGVMEFAYYDTAESGGLMLEFLHDKK